MISSEYASQISDIRQLLFPGSVKGKSQPDLKRQTIVSGSLYNLLPAVPHELYSEIINNVELFQQWAIRDQHHVYLAGDMRSEGECPDFDALRLHPTIFCSYHLGSYRLLIPYLISKGVVFTLLIDSKVASVQIEDFQEAVRASIKTFGAPANSCRIIDTNKSGLVFSMVRELKNKRCLLIFADGNTGIDSEHSEANNRVPVTLLGQTVAARKGIAYISSLTGSSITPFYTVRNRQNLFTSTVHFAPPMQPLAYSTRDDYPRAAMQYVYDILHEALANYYDQWESWFYIEKSLLLPKQQPTLDICPELQGNDELKFNSARFELAEPDKHEFMLFDRRYYRTTFISQDFMQFLQRFVQRPLTVEQATLLPNSSEGLLRTLIERGILRKQPDPGA